MIKLCPTFSANGLVVKIGRLQLAKWNNTWLVTEVKWGAYGVTRREESIVELLLPESPNWEIKK